MRRFAIVAVVLLTALLAPTPALAVDDVNTHRPRNALTVNGILAHERVFQRIANNNDGTRASGTPGYDASAAYLARRLKAAGYDVTVQRSTSTSSWSSLRPSSSRSRPLPSPMRPGPSTTPAAARSKARCSPPTTT